MHQVIIGDMTERLETAYLWLRRQLLLETSEPPHAPQGRRLPAVAAWPRARSARPRSTSRSARSRRPARPATMNGVIGRGLRDLAMGLVMTFPPERGRLEAASVVTANRGNALFANERDPGDGGGPHGDADSSTAAWAGLRRAAGLQAGGPGHRRRPSARRVGSTRAGSRRR